MRPSKTIAVSATCAVNIKGRVTTTLHGQCRAPSSDQRLLNFGEYNTLNMANVGMGIDILNSPHLQHKAEAQRKRKTCEKSCKRALKELRP